MTHKTIQLTRGFSTLVDEDKLDLINRHKWCALTIKTKTYAVSRVNKKYLYLHRFILGISDPKILVDHINCDGLDNRRANLRTVDRLGHSRNSKKKGLGKYKGIYLHKTNRNWVATITVNYKKIHLGCFLDERSAAHAYNEAAIKYFGEFANLNILAEHKLAEGHLELVTTPRLKDDDTLLIEDDKNGGQL